MKSTFNDHDGRERRRYHFAWGFLAAVLFTGILCAGVMAGMLCLLYEQLPG